MTIDAKLASEQLEEPPQRIGGILRRLGPGLIVAGSIVGSGELIATTRTGAVAGFWLLWLILIGCVIKVFAQVELGRYTIVTGRTTMEGLTEVPGPRIAGRGNWLVWFWFLMFVASLGQLGGIVGGVGQALAISAPLTSQGREFNEYVKLATAHKVQQAELARAEQLQLGEPRLAELAAALVATRAEIARRDAELLAAHGPKGPDEPPGPPVPNDEFIWASVITVLTSGILMVGRYGLIQSFSTAMVALFTLITIVNVVLLQSNPVWAVNLEDIVNGMRFRLPPTGDSQSAVGTALKTFGIIGVGASELVTYPYWCLEKGYARFTGPRDDSEGWGRRAAGWMRVMRWDAWCSMFVYTFATIAFYLLGAAILGRTSLIPGDREMVRTLSVMYEPVFGAWATILFLFGAFAVLYSTFFVANASHARVFSDVLRVVGFAAKDEASTRRRVTILSGLFPLICLTMYLFYQHPAELVLLSGLMQAVMLPMLAGAALFFRYRRGDLRLAPGTLWDSLLWLSAVGMLISGGWAAYQEVAKFFAN